MTESITSAQNGLLKDIRRAVSKGTLTDGGFAVAEGFHLLEEALASESAIASILVIDRLRDTIAAHIRGLKTIRVVSVPEKVFAELASTENSQGVITLVRPPSWTIEQIVRGKALVVVLDGVQDPGNAGTILRAAEAFGATGAVFLKGSVNPYNPKCLRAAAGSVFRLPLVVGVEDNLLLVALEQKKVTLLAAMPRARKLASDAPLAKSCAIIIGAEGRGVSAALEEKCTAIRIPTSGVESLNAATAAAVLLYEARRQRTA